MSNTTPEELIGRKVISIGPGFSGRGGRIMEVSSIENEIINLIDPTETISHGWQCWFKDRSLDFIFYTEENEKRVKEFL